MHKTLSEILSKGDRYTLMWGMNAALQRRELAADVAALFALSVEIEQSKAAILIHLLHGEPKAGMEMFLSLRSAQAVALKAVVKAKLPDYTKLFDKILKAGDKFEEHRNKFAHWPWASIDQLPDHICLINPKYQAELHVVTLERLGPTLEAQGKQSEIYLKKEWEYYEKRPDSVHAYDEAALSALADLGESAYHLLADFFTAIFRPSDPERFAKLAQLETRLQTAEP